MEHSLFACASVLPCDGALGSRKVEQPGVGVHGRVEPACGQQQDDFGTSALKRELGAVALTQAQAVASDSTSSATTLSQIPWPFCLQCPLIVAHASTPAGTCCLNHLRCGCTTGCTTAAASEGWRIYLALDLLIGVDVGFETNGIRPDGGRLQRDAAGSAQDVSWQCTACRWVVLPASCLLLQ